MMRNYFVLLLLFVSVTSHAQSLNVHYKNGGVQKENINNIDSLTFDEDVHGISIDSLSNKIDAISNKLSSDKISHVPSIDSKMSATNVKTALDELGKEYDAISNTLSGIVTNFDRQTYLFDWISQEKQESQIRRYVNTTSSQDASYVVSDSLIEFKGTIKSPYTFFNIGFDIPPTLYAETSKHYVVLLTGSVKSQNLRKVYLRNNSYAYSQMVGQDFEDGLDTKFETLLDISYAAGTTGNDRYVFFSSYPKVSGDDITVEYKLTRYCVFEYIEGWSIKDYISCYDNGGSYRLTSVSEGMATESYVDNAIASLNNNGKSSYTPYSGNFQWDVNMIINYGQSLSVGGGAASINDDFKNTLSFPGGINEWSCDLNIDDKSQVDTFYGDTLVYIKDMQKKDFPPISSCALAWMSLLEKENNIDLSNFDYQFLLSTPGYSGIQIEGLAKPGRFPGYVSPVGEQGFFYRRLLMGVQKGMENAHREGKTFGVPCLFYVQGEANVGQTVDEYYSSLKQLFDDLNTDIKSITGQKDDVAFITYQMSSYESRNCNSGPTYAQLQLVRDQDNVYLGGPMYQYDYGTDIYHPVDRAVIGLQAGIAAKRIINDGKPLPLFYPKSCLVQHSGDSWLLSILFDVPVPPMRFVTDVPDDWHNINGKQPNYGFALVKDGVDIIASEPVIKRGNTLVIKCNQNPMGASLNYATTGHYGGGNLCDSQNITIRCKNIDYKIDNFCPTFRGFIIQ